MGFFSRLLVPRRVRRAMHPGRAVMRAVTPKPIKKARRALHPIDNAVYSMQRSVPRISDQAGKAKLAFGGMETARSTTGVLRLQPGAGINKRNEKTMKVSTLAAAATVAILAGCGSSATHRADPCGHPARRRISRSGCACWPSRAALK